ncbi:MAG: NDP-sugar synthase [Hyphomicrobiales bacterium]
MILSAGFGTRLQELTKEKPKALVEVKGKPMLEYQLDRLISAGCKEVIVNTHHYSDQIIDFCNNYKGNIRINISDESHEILDTGGGILNAQKFFDGEKTIFIQNVDVYSSLNTNDFINYHQQNNAFATLAVKERKTSRYLLFDDSMRLCGWENVKTKEQKLVHPSKNLKRFAFSGIHAINPELLNHTQHSGKFSVIDMYLELAAQHKIIAYLQSEGFWIDAGKPEAIDHLNQIL